MMGNYTLYDPLTGEVQPQVISCPAARLAELVPEGLAAIEGSHDYNTSRVVFADDGFGSATPRVLPKLPPKPADTSHRKWEWHDSSGAWRPERTLLGAKEAAWTAIKAQREDRSQPAQVISGGRVWDTNARSRELIRDALMTASIVGPTWSSMWTLADNTRFLATAADLQGVVLAYASVTESVFQAAAAMREQVDAATSIGELNSITWPAP